MTSIRKWPSDRALEMCLRSPHLDDPKHHVVAPLPRRLEELLGLWLTRPRQIPRVVGRVQVQLIHCNVALSLRPLALAALREVRGVMRVVRGAPPRREARAARAR